MNATPSPSQAGRKLAIIVGVVLLIATVFVVVMCTAGDPKPLQSPQGFPAPNN